MSAVHLRRNRDFLLLQAGALAVGGLDASILLHRVAFWAIPLVAFVEGSGAALFAAASPAPYVPSRRPLTRPGRPGRSGGAAGGAVGHARWPRGWRARSASSLSI
ncbi:MAG TPA: hypothetical protein VGM21_11765 [Actinomycetota bacterium]